MPSNQYSKKEIADQINTFFADNDEQGITAEDLRIVTDDYMNQSKQEPMLIYSGWWTQRSNRRPEYYSTSSNPNIDTFGEYKGDAVLIKEKIVDTYINPSFFRQHNPLDPTNTNNLWSVDTIAVPGASNGIKTINPKGVSGMVRLIVTVQDNVITKLEVDTQGGNNIKGESYEKDIGGNTITFTYNSVIKHNSGTNNEQLFILTENPSRRSGEQGHSKMKTILQVSSQIPGQDSFIFMKENDDVLFSGGITTVTTELPASPKHRNWKDVTTPLQATVTIWRVPRFN